MTNDAKSVIGPLGRPLTLETLPSSQTVRWVRRRKAEVVVAVKGGLLTMQEATERYNISDDEFLGWYEAYHLRGMAGLQISKLAERHNRGRQ
jgi:uncharacterized protein DUF1153